MTKTKTNTNRKFRRIVAVVAVGSVAFGAYTMGVFSSPAGAAVYRPDSTTDSNVQKKQNTSQQSTVNNFSALRKAGGGQQEY